MLSQEMGVLHRLNSPVISTFVNTDSIVFQRSGFTPRGGGVAGQVTNHLMMMSICAIFRQKSGIWGFRSDKTEDVGGYQAKVRHRAL